jgi:multiple sugar transport system permease protein
VRMSEVSRKRTQFILVSLALPVLLLVLFVVYPAADLLNMSFTDWNGLNPVKSCIGLSNYKDMLFNSPDLWLSLRNNLIYFSVHLVFIFIELLLAAMSPLSSSG